MTWQRGFTILSCLLGIGVMAGCASHPLKAHELPDRPHPLNSQALNEIDHINSATARPISSILLPPRAYLSFSDSKFVVKWLLLGPFQFAETAFEGDQQSKAIEHPFVPDEGALDGTQQPPEGAKWKPRHFRDGNIAGMVDLDGFFNTPEHAAAYAVTWIESPKDMEVRMLVGSDDYIKVWINGEHVHTYATKRRNARPDQDAVTVTLKKGLNRVVVKSVDVVYDWCFFLRFTTPTGRQTVVHVE
jgi:hypothetical protein